MQSDHLTPIDYLMGAAVALTWGMGVVFAKAAIEHFPPILLMTLRFAVTAAALVWFVRPPLAQLGRLFGIALVAAALQYSLTFTGLKGLDASVAALVIQLEVPFLVLLGVLFLHEQAGWLQWLGIALAFLGVGLIAGEPRVAGAWVSVLMVVAGTLSWAVGQAMIRTLKDIDGLTLTAWIAVCACPQLLVMSLIFESGHAHAIAAANWVVWAAVVYLGLIMTAFGYALWYSLVRRHPISRVGPMLLLLPLFSTAGAVLFLGETLTWQIVLGGAVILTGVGSVLFDQRRAVARRLSARGDLPKGPG